MAIGWSECKADKMAQLPLTMPARPGPQDLGWIEAPSNKQARDWLARWPDWPGPWRGLNIWGPPASGKTLLGQIFARQTDAIWLDSLPATSRPAPSATPLILDNLTNSPAWDEEELLHLINDSAAAGGGLLLLSDGPVAAMGWTLPDLQSRLRSFAAEELAAPDDIFLKALLDRHFIARQCLVPGTVLDYIVSRMPRSHQAAAVLAAEIDARSLASRKPVTISLVRALFEQQEKFNFDN